MSLDDVLEDAPLSERGAAALSVIAEYRRRIAAHEGIYTDPAAREKGTYDMDVLEANRHRVAGVLH